MLNPFIFFSEEEREEATWFSGIDGAEDDVIRQLQQ
jgi:hypothetical protein